MNNHNRHPDWIDVVAAIIIFVLAMCAALLPQMLLAVEAM